jgi:hypothetical protein
MMATIGKAVVAKVRPTGAVRNRLSGDCLADITHSSNEAFRLRREPALPPTKCFEGEMISTSSFYRDLRPQAAGTRNLHRINHFDAGLSIRKLAEWR